MRNVLFLLFLVCVVANSYAQTQFNLSGIFPDGNPVKENEVLFLNDSCNFYLVDQSGNRVDVNSIEWEFKALSKDEINYEIICRDKSESFKVKIDSALYKNDLCANFFRKSFNGDNSVYYSTLVSCKAELSSGQTLQIEKPVLMNLLPSKPHINILKFEYSSYDNQYNYFEDGFLTIQVIADRCSKALIMNRLISYSGYLTTSYMPFDDPENQIGSFEFRDSDAYYIINALNENGGVSSDDTLWVKAFMPTSSESIEADESISFYPNPASDILYINGDLDNLLSIEIYNDMGQNVKRINNITPSINISDLHSGIYLISYVDKKTHKKRVFKFMKT